MESTFEKDLESLINRYSQENASNTPDFIVAQYLLGCLATWNVAVQRREEWYGRGPVPVSEPCDCPDPIHGGL